MGDSHDPLFRSPTLTERAPCRGCDRLISWNRCRAKLVSWMGHLGCKFPRFVVWQLTILLAYSGGCYEYGKGALTARRCSPTAIVMLIIREFASNLVIGKAAWRYPQLARDHVKALKKRFADPGLLCLPTSQTSYSDCNYDLLLTNVAADYFTGHNCGSA
jgi:hypothetical protein